MSSREKLGSGGKYVEVFFVAIKIQNFLCNHSDQKNDFLFLKKKVVNFVKAFMI